MCVKERSQPCSKAFGQCNLEWNQHVPRQAECRRNGLPLLLSERGSINMSQFGTLSRGCLLGN
jgi:hypothetical protein